MENKDSSSPLMHNLSDTTEKFFTSKLLIVLGVVILVGLASGYFLARSRTPGENGGVVGNIVNKAAIPAGKTFGSDDTKTYKDTAEGVLKEGGVEDEGQYHLERTGRESQNVYMTSSQVDLSLFIGRKVKVWGQTQKAKVAGWLMDVGRVEVLQ